MELLEGASEWLVPERNGKSQRFSVRFSSLEGFLINRRQFTLIFPVGPVKAFHTQFRGERLEVASMDAGGSKIPGVVQKRRSKTMGARARSGVGRDWPFTFFVSEILDGLEREGS
jgi:hypothetical protein